MSTLNLALRFTLELCALLALAFWGASIEAGWGTTIALAILAPLLAATAWGLLVSPKARIRAPAAVQLGVELVVFLVAAAGLVATGQVWWALLFATAVAIHELWRLVELTKGTG